MGEEFSASATDSFGNACTITVVTAEGTPLTAGTTVSIYLVATDGAGNRVYSTLIPEISVWGKPIITYLGEDNGLLSASADVESLFEAEDCFGTPITGAKLVVNYEPLVEGTLATVTVTATDRRGNVNTQVYKFCVAEAHDYAAMVVAPTCTEQGYTVHTCTVCGDSYTDTPVSATGHSESEWITDVEPTCTQAGSKYTQCTVCQVELQREEISARHDYGDDEYCDDCGAKKIYTRVNASGVESETGEYILFGSYPQTEVTDSTLKSALTSFAGTKPTSSNSYAWTSYGYYISSSNSSDYMWYQDVTYGGEEYRAVYFTSYRPYYTSSSSSTGNTYQDDNGYYTSTVYWFKYEPIKWKIIDDSESGYATLLCEMLIDSQEYNYTTSSQTVNGSTVYANNYEYSTIRAWLNDTFYQTAFSELEQAIIQTVTVDNSAATTSSSSNSYACNNTQDKVWLLSYQEAKAITGSTGSTTEREKQTTDYAQCQGAWTSTSTNYAGNGYWWLRSPCNDNSSSANYVYSDGTLDSNYYVNSTSGGGCPALKIRL